MEAIEEVDKFDSKPFVKASEFVDYFNLEYGLEFDPDAIKFTEHDFSFIGFFKGENGQEQMYWSVKGKGSVWALAVPVNIGGYMLSMTSTLPDDLEPITIC